MRISDNREATEARNDRELEGVLARRYGVDGAAVNSFWMSHAEDWPALAMLVRDDLACLDYMADSGGTTFTSQGDVPALTKGATTEFRLDSQRRPVPNRRIIRYADAVRAAKEFMHTKDLPQCIKWLRL